MAADTLLWVLAVLTATTGLALAYMIARRVGDTRRMEREIELEEARRDGEERILAHQALAEASEAARICPSCHSRYRIGVRVCSRDDSELSALN